MVGRLEILCVLTIASWLAGVGLERYLDGSQPWYLIALVSAVGLVAAPLIGTRLVTGLSELAEWENSGPRDFFPAALALAVPICFGLPIAICWVLGS